MADEYKFEWHRRNFLKIVIYLNLVVGMTGHVMRKKSEILDLIQPCMKVSANRKIFSIFDLKYIKEILKLLPSRR